MQVANNARAIEKHLKEHYEKQIESVQTAAQQEADEISKSYNKQAKNLENDIFVTAKSQAQTMKTQRISAAKTQARTDVERALGVLADEVSAILKEKYMKSDDKKQHLETIRNNVVESITSRGMNPKDFDFEEDEKQLYVKAQTDELLLEDGLDIRLDAFKQKVIKHVKDEVAQ